MTNDISDWRKVTSIRSRWPFMSRLNFFVISRLVWKLKWWKDWQH